MRPYMAPLPEPKKPTAAPETVTDERVHVPIGSDVELADYIDEVDEDTGGGSTTLARGAFVGFGSLNLNDGGAGVLAWDYLSGSSPANPLDLADRSRPLILGAGVYAVSASVRGDNMSVGGFCHVELVLDAGPSARTVYAESRGATAARPYAFVETSETWYLAAGAAIQVVVYSYDGAAARDFGMPSALVQQVA